MASMQQNVQRAQIPRTPFHDKMSIFSHSLGDHSAHKLPFKLRAASLAGFKAVEISLIDLEDYASSFSHLRVAAEEIHSLCEVLGLKVTCLQPLRDVVEAKDARMSLQKAIELFPVMDALDTELLLLCSSSLPSDQLDSSLENTVANLRAIGNAASSWKPQPKKVAFEALSWGTHISLWSQAWEVVRSTDMENVGLCLDSFNTLAREWADPTAHGGVQENASENIKKSMQELSKLPGAKIFLLQIGDGARLKEPLDKGTFEKPALMTWSRSSRLFPMESDLGGYLPVMEFMRATLKTGYNGHWSLEVFNDSLKSPSESAPTKHAIRGFNGLLKLRNALSHHHHHTTRPESTQLLPLSPLTIHLSSFNSEESDSPALTYSPTTSSSSEFSDDLGHEADESQGQSRLISQLYGLQTLNSKTSSDSIRLLRGLNISYPAHSED